jgi:hypothetical protein
MVVLREMSICRDYIEAILKSHKQSLGPLLVLLEGHAQPRLSTARRAVYGGLVKAHQQSNGPCEILACAGFHSRDGRYPSKVRAKNLSCMGYDLSLPNAALMQDESARTTFYRD